MTPPPTPVVVTVARRCPHNASAMDNRTVIPSKAKFSVRKGRWVKSIDVDGLSIRRHDRRVIIAALRAQRLPVPVANQESLEDIQRSLLALVKENPDLFDPKPSTVQFDRADVAIGSAITIPSAISSAGFVAKDGEEDDAAKAGEGDRVLVLPGKKKKLPHPSESKEQEDD